MRGPICVRIQRFHVMFSSSYFCSLFTTAQMCCAFPPPSRLCSRNNKITVATNFLTLFGPGGGGGRFDPQQIKTVVT